MKAEEKERKRLRRGYFCRPEPVLRVCGYDWQLHRRIRASLAERIITNPSVLHSD